MKKMFNGKFLFILSLSLIILILLVFGALYLFDDSDDTFVKSGYVLNPLSEKVEKYFFEGNTSYKTNLSSMIEFTDVDNNEVSVLKDSFIHYMDGSLSFLKNGAILDLDSVTGSGTVIFYNITNKSIIDKDGNGYVIENSKNDIKLNNFMGRISDNKYIIVGNVKAKIPGNESLIEGDYFEIVYVEDGIVNIENKDVKYQVAADETLFYVNNLVIDLGDKKISLNDEDIMSITEITIDGNENVEIIPVDDKDDDNKPNDNETGGDIQTPGDDQNGNGDLENGDGSGTGSGEGINPDNVEDIIVSLKKATVSSTSVSVIFDIMNNTPDDRFMLKVTNMDTGRTVDMTAQVLQDVEINVNLLSPKTRYLFTVINEKDDGKYFQKIFETNDFGISLERTYATDSEIGYKINVDEETDITNAKLSLYKFNEETHQNEVVKTSYVDGATGEIKYIEKVVWLSDIDKNGEIVFDGLDSNTIYTAVLDEFSVESSNFKDVYNITLTSMTLKKTPSFSDMEANKDLASGSFKLSLGNIIDPDNAITSYTYLVYENDNPDKLVINPITKTNASPIEIKVGNGENELKNDTNYFYKVVIEYYDNEKYVEYTTSDRINFVMGSDPYVTVVPKEELISYNTIGATIYLTDNSCLVSMPNREGCASENSSTVITIKKNSVNGEVIVKSFVADFEIVNDEIKYDLFVDGLQEGTQYTIEVSAILNDDQDQQRVEIMHTDDSKRNISTKTLSSFMAIYPAEDKLLSSANHVVNQRVKLEASKNNTGSLSPEESVAAIKKVVISLYEGNHLDDVKSQDPLIAPVVFTSSETVNLKEMFYDNYYTITTDGTFGLDIDALKSLGENGKLSPEYTIMIRAYYDLAETNEVKIENNVMVYNILESLLLDNVEEPIIIVNEITNGLSANIFDELSDSGTVVGYTVNAVYDRRGLVANGLMPQKINIYVYDKNFNKVKFYIKNDSDELVLVDKISESINDLEIGNYLTEVYMDYGIEYGTTSLTMVRGNSYYVGYEIEVSSDSGSSLYPSSNNADSPSDYGVYKKTDYTTKETPKVGMYIAKSDANSITYRYVITDPDNALYRESSDVDYGFYYKVNGGIEQKLSISSTGNKEYSGDIIVSGLNNNDTYQLYYKKNIKNTGVIDDDVVNYLDGKDEGVVLFDGFYDANDEIYNFEYEIINNPLTDNKVTIKLLASEEILNRVVSYRVKFKDSLGNELNKELWQLSKCAASDNEARCFSVDYIDLKNAGMQSSVDKTNIISVTIEALYDNGLTGYDYTVGDGKDYQYMIMQNNNTSEYGKYISFDKSGKISLWSEELNVTKGYYTYSFNNSERTSLFYKSMMNSNNYNNINNIGLSSLGYNSSYGILNPKMISVDTMKCDNNTFSFSSITPKVSVSQKTSLINGSVMALSISGLDLNDIKNEGGEYYLYIDVWKNENDALNHDVSAIVRPRVKIKVDVDNPNKTYEAVIDGVASVTSSEKYYFNVYAYLYKNGKYEFTQLFDESVRDSYETKTYSFGTKNGESLYTNREVTYQVDDTIYGNRILNTKINLTRYQNNYPYNFDVMYMICEDNTCTKDSGYIFKKEILDGDVSSTIVSQEDITKYDLEYNKNYYIFIYAVASLYEKDVNGDYVEGIQYVNLIPIKDRIFKLTALREPSFVVTRKAGYEDGKYFIDFTINVNDLDRTIVNGKYFVKLVNSSGDVVGTLQEINDDGTYIDIEDYENYEFDALVVNKKIRITDLDADTKYSIMVYSDAYVNNYSQDIPKEDRTYEVSRSHSIYTTDSYGVTFGHDISYVITDNSYIVLFRSGTNFDNVVNVNYSISLDDEFNGGLIVSGTDTIGDKNKFEFNDESGYGMYVITRNDGVKNTEGMYYLITLSFDVKDPNDPEKLVNLTAAYNPSFTASVAYVKDMENNN